MYQSHGKRKVQITVRESRVYSRSLDVEVDDLNCVEDLSTRFESAPIKLSPDAGGQ